MARGVGIRRSACRYTKLHAGAKPVRLPPTGHIGRVTVMTNLGRRLNAKQRQKEGLKQLHAIHAFRSLAQQVSEQIPYGESFRILAGDFDPLTGSFSSLEILAEGVESNANTEFDFEVSISRADGGQCRPNSNRTSDLVFIESWQQNQLQRLERKTLSTKHGERPGLEEGIGTNKFLRPDHSIDNPELYDKLDPKTVA